MNQKINISKEGIDAGTATEADDLNYSSDYNTLKYYTSGTVTISGTADPSLTTTVFGTVAHNLGYYPYTAIYCNSEGVSATRYHPYSLIQAGEVSERLTATMGTDIIKFIYRITAGAGTLEGTANFVYKIFRNDLGLS